jgi:hypothetical protein
VEEKVEEKVEVIKNKNKQKIFFKKVYNFFFLPPFLTLFLLPPKNSNG